MKTGNLSWDQILQNTSPTGYSSSELNYYEQITSFFIPFKVDRLKLAANESYYQEVDRNNGKKETSTNLQPTRSLINLLQKYGTKTIKRQNHCYPIWFYLCFPDVVLWALNDGWEIIENELQTINLSKTNRNFGSPAPIGEEFNSETLKLVINKYLKTVNVTLEIT